MDRVGAGNFLKFKNVIKDAHDSFFQETIVWKKLIDGLPRYGEDNLEATYQSINLKGLMDFNYFRKWSTSYPQLAGNIDKQTIVLLLNRQYLEESSLLDIEGRLPYDQGADRFVYRGIVYKSVGDTLLSQSFDDPLLYDILLQREELKTGENPHHAEFP